MEKPSTAHSENLEGEKIIKELLKIHRELQYTSNPKIKILIGDNMAAIQKQLDEGISFGQIYAHLTNLVHEPSLEEDSITEVFFSTDAGAIHLEDIFQERLLRPFDDLTDESHLETRNILRASLKDFVEILYKDKTPTRFSKIQKQEILLTQALTELNIDRVEAERITETLRLAAYSHNGWVLGGGVQLVSGGIIPSEAKMQKFTDYETTLSSVDEMKEAAVHWYYTQLTENPEVEDISPEEFDRLVAKWSQFKNVAHVAVTQGVPTLGALAAGYVTGGLSLGAWHILAPVAGALLPAAFTESWNRNTKGKSRLYDMQLLGGLAEFKKDLEGQGYVKPRTYSQAAENSRVFWSEKPSRRVRYNELTVSDLSYILERGQQNAKDVQKRTRLVGAVAAVATAVYFHGGLFGGADGTDQAAQQTLEGQYEKTIPDTSLDHHPTEETWLEKFFTFNPNKNGVLGLTAPHTTPCYSPITCQ